MAKTKAKVNLGSLEKDLIKYVVNVLGGAASAIATDMYLEGKNAIQLFYEDYDPIFYHRHYYNFEQNSFKRYYSNPHNQIFRGGIQLTPGSLNDIYQDSAREVFDMVYAGFHGVASGFYRPKSFTPLGVMDPSPMQILYDKRDQIVKNINSYIVKGKEKAKKANYSFIKV